MRQFSFRLFILAAAVTSGGCDAQQLRKATIDEGHKAAVGPNIALPTSFDTLPLVEPHISAHPVNGGHLVAAAMVVTDINRPYESCRLVSFVSSDGGTTWKETIHDWWGYDPWTAIADDGTTVLSWIGTKGSFQDLYPIQFFLSNDGGSSWQTKVQTLPGMYDGTKLTAAPTLFYFTTVRFRDHEGADVVLYARNGGEFIEQGKIDGNGQRLNFCEPAIRYDGKVIVPYSSRDGACVEIFDPAERKFSSKYTVTKRTNGLRGYARLVVDPNEKSPYRDHTYFVRGLGSAGLTINRSTDGGVTWEKEVRIDLFDAGQTRSALVPSAAISRSGVLAITWVDEQENNNVYFTASYDGGASFIRPVCLTAMATNPRTRNNGDVANKFPGGGHYLGLAARADGTFQAIWSDSRSGVFQLQTCSIQP